MTTTVPESSPAWGSGRHALWMSGCPVDNRTIMRLVCYGVSPSTARPGPPRPRPGALLRRWRWTGEPGEARRRAPRHRHGCGSGGGDLGLVPGSHVGGRRRWDGAAEGTATPGPCRRCRWADPEYRHVDVAQGRLGRTGSDARRVGCSYGGRRR